jgi:hypothetical protein
MYDEIMGHSMKHKRKRAAGGGRKPNDLSGPGTPFTVRLPADVLDSLRAAADKGETMSGALVRRLRFAVAREREAERNPAIQEICNLIADVGGIAYGQKDWHIDPTLFRLFKLAVVALLDGIAPEGAVEWPKDHVRSMEDMAQVFAENVLLDLHRRAAPQPTHAPDVKKMLANEGIQWSDSLADIVRLLDARARRRFYDMQKARRVLGFENGKRKNEGDES